MENENIKDSNALGKEVGKVHWALCKLVGNKPLIVTTLKDYVEQNIKTNGSTKGK